MVDKAFFQQKRDRSGGLDLTDIFGATFTEYLVALLPHGIMVSAGLSRDGGAAHVTVFCDGAKRREWVESVEDLCEFLDAACAAVGATPGVISGSPETEHGRASQGSRRGA